MCNVYIMELQAGMAALNLLNPNQVQQENQVDSTQPEVPLVNRRKATFVKPCRVICFSAFLALLITFIITIRISTNLVTTLLDNTELLQILRDENFNALSDSSNEN